MTELNAEAGRKMSGSERGGLLLLQAVRAAEKSAQLSLER
jgi:hypothetical protein